MAKMYWEKDANPQALEGKRIAVIGYGSQGRAHALNLRDSGLDVVVGLRPGGPSWKQAEQDGWKLVGPSEATEGRGRDRDARAGHGAARHLHERSRRQI